MKNIFITATNTDVGKTYTTIKLISAFAEKKIRPGVFKPIETGVRNFPNDASLLLFECQKVNPLFHTLNVKDICTYDFSLPAAPYVADKFQKIKTEKILENRQKLEKLCDILLIEGAGGLMVPIKKEYFMIDLLKDLQAQPLLVTHDKLGCINDTLLSLNLLKNRGFSPQWCVNVREPDSFAKTTLPFYKEYFKEIFILDEDLPALLERLLNN